MGTLVTAPLPTERYRAWLEAGLFIDVEMAGANVFKVGVVLGEQTFHAGSAAEARALVPKLARLANGAAFVGGHHLLAHDLPQVAASFGDSGRQLGQHPVVDSLILSTLTHPENPYHALVKDHKLVVASRNRPVEDARLSRQVLEDCLRKATQATGQQRHGLALALHAYQNSDAAPNAKAGLAAWAEIADYPPLDNHAARDLWLSLGPTRACPAALRDAWGRGQQDPALGRALAHVAAWLPVAGAESILPGWVRHSAPGTVGLVRRLRATPCGDSNCAYCREHHDPRALLVRFFGHENFRPQPELPGHPGRSLQEELVRVGLAGEPVLGILPTGGGKSLCFQLPALAHHERTGDLTVVISPLQALMQDQVEGLARLTRRRRAAAITGLLSPVERSEALERVRLGNTGLLYISPEQLRSRSLLRAVESRRVAAWVFDEAHCLAKWGHDFRPDYLYAAKYIARHAKSIGEPPPPVFAFTATAKADVRDEIVTHLREHLGQQTTVLDAGAERSNLAYLVEATPERSRLARIAELLANRLEGQPGTACVFARTRDESVSTADVLGQQFPAFNVRHFHAGLTKDEKKQVLHAFLEGDCRVVVATNAFGMGIDKDNIRLVIHSSIPGSLENYLQEAGRAGRDRQPAECILLYDESDLEAQFRLLGRTQLEAREIQTVWLAIQRAEREGRDEVVLTAREIADQAADQGDDLAEMAGSDEALGTRIRSAIATLEERGFLERMENVTQALSAQPQVSDLEEAKARMARLDLADEARELWLAIMGALLVVSEESPSLLDALTCLPEVERERERAKERGNRRASREDIVFRTIKAMASPPASLIKLETRLGVSFDLTGPRPVHKRLAVASAFEEQLRQALEEADPDAEGWVPFVLRAINQRLLDRGLDSSPDQITRFFSTWQMDGKRFHGRTEAFRLWQQNKESGRIRLPQGWAPVKELQQRRLAMSAKIVEFLLEQRERGERNVGEAAIKVTFAMEDLEAAVRADLVLRDEAGAELPAKLRHSLCYLHEHGIIELRDGKALITQSMTLKVLEKRQGDKKRRQFLKGDFEALRVHYAEKVFQIHVMEEYAKRGLERLTSHLALIKSYFELGKEEFVRTFVGGGSKVLMIATSINSHHRIFGALRNPDQQAIVGAPDARSMLVLAGPGSGKSRVIVHRCAWLLRVRRVRPERILMVCFNRHSASELRHRLWDLVGADAAGVMIQTYHGLALRLLGWSLAPEPGQTKARDIDFADLLRQAARRIDGTLPAAEDGLADDAAAGAWHERIQAGFTHLLVDEYQDIDADEYAFLSALAAKGQRAEKRPALLAVGDDDQAIYGFKGARLDFIRKFEQEFGAHRQALLQNYRSTSAIIEAANLVIRQNRDRLKVDHDIRANRERASEPPGGRWTARDPVAAGRVQVLTVPDATHEAVAVRDELRRLRGLDPDGSWSDFAVLGRGRRDLFAIRALLEAANIPVTWRGERESLPVFRLREVVSWLEHLDQCRDQIWTADQVDAELAARAGAFAANPWWSLLRALAEEWRIENPEAELPVPAIRHFFGEALAERQRDPLALAPGVALCTVHGAKGLEFGQVVVAGGSWRTSRPAEEEEQRRLYYVAMTRAKENLILVNRQDEPLPYRRDLDGADLTLRAPGAPSAQDVARARRRFDRLGPDMMVISWAGYRGESSPSARALASLTVGDPLTWEQTDKGLYLHAGPHRIAKLSKAATETWQPRLPSIRATHVAALLERRAEDEAQPTDDRASPKRTRWEYPVVDVEWEA